MALLRFDILTVFPGMFEGPFDESIVRRARDAGIVEVNVHNIRDFALDKHRTTDDAPFGGGAGMVMKPEPIFAAAEAVLSEHPSEPRNRSIILLSPSGRTFTQRVAEELAQLEHLLLICGHYEGIDERVAELVATDEISVGDYVLTGGELPALVIVDAVTRLLPGVVSCEASTVEESFSFGLLEYPHYTRPADFRGWNVPETLLSGNHAAIARWRREQALERTWRRRPDLLTSIQRNKDDRLFLAKLQQVELQKSERGGDDEGSARK